MARESWRCRAGLRGDVRSEWDELKQHDVVFLMTVRPPEEADVAAMAVDGAPSVMEQFGLTYVRGAEVIEVKDEGAEWLEAVSVPTKPASAEKQRVLSCVVLAGRSSQGGAGRHICRVAELSASLGRRALLQHHALDDLQEMQGSSSECSTAAGVLAIAFYGGFENLSMEGARSLCHAGARLPADGGLMNDFTGRVKREEWKPPAGTLRTLTLALDPAQYQMDMNHMQAHKSEDVYSTFNLLMRRKPKVPWGGVRGLAVRGLGRPHLAAESRPRAAERRMVTGFQRRRRTGM
jgi:Intron-binding protein aquarius N-terminus